MHRLVGECVVLGGLARQDDGRYSLGMRLWELGVQTPTARTLRAIALPRLEDLTGPPAHVRLETIAGAAHLAARERPAEAAALLLAQPGRQAGRQASRRGSRPRIPR
ncbi:hypothetical protein E3T28_01550 [Cryobacterium sinapicolor]|uniref:Uncharacterized protein n=1 Tax=Cryobacterium sinapicolor TaxID=1259236 RepID=A0ABY2JJY7_9MICO|nr:hypothetical protein [Cryobacterium sinapicolor]TFD05031.1 hypothetical protein E3T28_01550 [Cryobacterium sinapicolor]